jgi:hypothetical protein
MVGSPLNILVEKAILKKEKVRWVTMNVERGTGNVERLTLRVEWKTVYGLWTSHPDGR